MITIDKKLQGIDYTVLVSGNSGENQLIVTVSLSQAETSPMVVTSASIDGGAKVIRSSSSTWIHHNSLGREFRRYLRQWMHQGAAPTKQEEEALLKQEDIAVREFCNYWELAYSPQAELTRTPMRTKIVALEYERK